MTISPPEETEKSGVGALARGFGSGAFIGAGLAGCVVAMVIGEWTPAAIGLGLIAANIVLVVVWQKYAARGRPPRPEPRLALARIESRRALSSEHADIPVEFVLTVAPDDAAGFRAKVTQDINLVDIPDYKPRTVIVVEYRPDRPWDVKIVTEPDDHWARRAETESIDSAPESAMATPAAEEGCGFCLVALAGLLIGAAIVVFAWRGDLFDDDEGPGSTTTTTVTGTSSTQVTITGEIMLMPGQMRGAVEELIALAGTDKAVSIGIDEDYVSVEAPKPTDPRLVDSFRFRDDKARTEGPSGTRSASDEPLIDLRALPYERLPQLVIEAKATLGIAAPTSWHISFDHDPITGALEIGVSVRDDYGHASLTADAQGNVTERSPR
ncbi:hypothetical protein [Yinghuangia sp. YIM S10712]|uniref:hypothetical protein n=1 Tax=Yinghuangia sp. YIM S10712 TaxID=3436930 RepID=UPI003F5383E9